jgi:DNA-binding transcriptional regulator YhcF (GntR family)
MPENLRPGFIQVPIAVYHSAELSDGAFKTYCMLKKHHNFEDPLGTFPSINRIAQLRNKTMRTIHKHVKELKRHGFITVMSGGKGKSNRYIFKDPECICTHCKKDSVWDDVEEMVYLNFDEIQNMELQILEHLYRRKQYSFTIDDVVNLIEDTRFRIALEEE